MWLNDLISILASTSREHFDTVECMGSTEGK